MAGKPWSSNLAQSVSSHRFRTRILARRWMRNAMRVASAAPPLLEAAFTMLRMPLFQRIAEHVFFARGSFPTIEPSGLRVAESSRT